MGGGGGRTYIVGGIPSVICRRLAKQIDNFLAIVRIDVTTVSYTHLTLPTKRIV